MAIPKPAKIDPRICFCLNYFETEKDAERYAEHVRKEGLTYNGGWFHGKPCGREKQFDHFDKELNKQLYAVSD